MEQNEIIEGRKMERWKMVIGYEGHYKVSTYGRVKALDRAVNDIRGYMKIRKGKLLKPFMRGDYLAVGLTKRKRVKYISVHIIEATAFIPNPERKGTVNHLDGIKTNNYIDNLAWATESEQILHAISIGLFVPRNPMKGKFGKDHNKSIPVFQYSIDGQQIASYGSANEAARITGFHQTGISKACRGELKTHKGFHWYNSQPSKA